MKVWFLGILSIAIFVYVGQTSVAQPDMVPGMPMAPVNLGTLPAPLTAAPPPDPPQPAWGNFLDPVNPPILQRQTEYNVVGPSTGVIQNIEGQDYRAVISEPTAILDSDRQIGQVVDLNRPDGFAPVGVFGDHTLPMGTFHVSYRYLQNSFDQLYVGSHRVSLAGQYPYTPANGMANSQVALLEYGATRDFTMMALLPFQHNQINSQSATGDYKSTFTNPGDIRIMGLLVVNRGEQAQGHASFGLSIPVGFLEDAKNMPSTTQPNLPYQIRTSSGSYDLLFGYTYRAQTVDWTWGAQANAVVPTGINTLGYELGNQLQLTSWLSRRWTDRWSTSGRLDAHFVGNTRGADTRLNTALSPANLNTSQGGDYLNGLLGLNFYLSRPESRIFEQRLFLEAGVPFYQSLNGPQLGISWILNAGWGMSF